jgi:hypothetical protein
MSSADPKKTILAVHATTVPHLDIVEKAILDILILKGRAQIIQEAVP